MKKTVSILATALLFILLLALWFFVAIYVGIGYETGILSCITDAYGAWVLWMLLCLGMVLFLAPVYVRFFTSKKWLIAVISLMLCLAFIALIGLAHWSASSKFETFTKEKWAQFPNQRYLMLDDLEENHGIITMSEEEAMKLLGEPGSKSSNSLYYDDAYGLISIRLENNRVSSIEYTDFW